MRINPIKEGNRIVGSTLVCLCDDPKKQVIVPDNETGKYDHIEDPVFTPIKCKTCGDKMEYKPTN